MSEIGLVGRSPGLYNLYLGGAHDGSRLSKLHARDVDGDAIVAALRPVFAAYATDRKYNESFGDFVIRAGIVARTIAGLDFHENLAPACRGRGCHVVRLWRRGLRRRIADGELCQFRRLAAVGRAGTQQW